MFYAHLMRCDYGCHSHSRYQGLALPGYMLCVWLDLILPKLGAMSFWKYIYGIEPTLSLLPISVNGLGVQSYP
jgi:hypothetical protein